MIEIERDGFMQTNRRMACHTTPRLLALRDVLAGARSVADIGCDHAYLPILLVQEGKAEHIIAADVREGPLRRAQANIARFGLLDRIETRLGNGLAPVAPGEAEAIAIAGMGGTVICQILQEGEAVARAAELLALQPMSAASDLRRFLYQNSYQILRERLVQEDARIYTIILAQSGRTECFSELDCYISPALRAERPPLYCAYVEKLSMRLRAALEGMRHAQTPLLQLGCQEALLKELEQLIKGENIR